VKVENDNAILKSVVEGATKVLGSKGLELTGWASRKIAGALKQEVDIELKTDTGKYVVSIYLTEYFD
jgi:hypothetical protein